MANENKVHHKIRHSVRVMMDITLTNNHHRFSNYQELVLWAMHHQSRINYPTHWVSIFIGGLMTVIFLDYMFLSTCFFLIQSNTCSFFMKMKVNFSSIRLFAVSISKLFTASWFDELSETSFWLLCHPVAKFKTCLNHKLSFWHHITRLSSPMTMEKFHLRLTIFLFQEFAQGPDQTEIQFCQ